MLRECQTIFAGPREAILRSADVAVFGGGPAGICAAVAAARRGAKAVLVERYGFLGGMASAGMVNPIYGFGYFEPGRQIVTGLAEEMVEELRQIENGTLGHRRRAECLRCSSPEYCATSGVNSLVPFDPEAFKLAALRMIRNAGVDLLLYCSADAVVMHEDARPVVVVTSKAGRQSIAARVIIDATGDGDVAVAAGAAAELGRSSDGATQPQSLIFHVVGINYEEDRLLFSLDEPVEGISRLLLFRLPRSGEYIVNCDTGLFGLNPLNPCDMTRAHTHALSAARRVVQWLRQHVSGCEDCRLVATASQLAIRESRRILGDYILTKEDVLSARKFPDGIARGCFPLDIHDLTSSEGDDNPMSALPCGEYYEIPYRCLLPRGIEGLLTAGRCISGTHEAHGSYRVMATCMAIGEAAGTAAAMAVQNGCTPRQLDAAIVRRALAEQGTVLCTSGDGMDWE
jgi:hypothetical protein